MAQSELVGPGPSAVAPGVRVPIALPAMVHFRTAGGEALDDEVRKGHTRDVNEAGLGLEVPAIPEAVATRLSSLKPGEVLLEVDVTVGRQTLRVSGRCTWLRVLDKHGTHRCLAGIEYATDSKPAKRLVTLARGRERQLLRWRVAAGVTLAAALAAGFTYWRWYAGHVENLAAVERELEDVRAAEAQGSRALVKTSSELETLRADLADREEALARHDVETEELRDETLRLQAQLADVEKALRTVSLSTPAGMDQQAVWHLERARLFWDRNDEAASLAEYDRAVRLEPTLAEAYLGLAEANMFFDRLEVAAKAYRRYLELRPGADEAVEVRATLAEIEGRLKGGAPRP